LYDFEMSGLDAGDATAIVRQIALKLQIGDAVVGKAVSVHRDCPIKPVDGCSRPRS
jgi:hypothetical protein